MRETNGSEGALYHLSPPHLKCSLTTLITALKPMASVLEGKIGSWILDHFAEVWRAGSVLVQREMECERSRLASIARASAGRVAPPNWLGKGRILNIQPDDDRYWWQMPVGSLACGRPVQLPV